MIAVLYFRSGLKDEDTEEEMVDRPIEDTQTFLLARVQSQK